MHPSTYELYNLRYTLLTKSSSQFGTRVKFSKVNIVKNPSWGRLGALSDHWTSTTRKFNVNSKLLRVQLANKFKLFLLYLNFANGSGQIEFRIHGQYRSMFLTDDNGDFTPYVNINKSHKKWIHSYNFLLNIFYAKINLLMFANKILKTEALSFNWSYELLPYTIFKRSSPFFFLRDPEYGEPTTEAYEMLSSYGMDLAFVSDIKYQRKSVFYLRICGVYTIGLVPYSVSPWTVHYSIPAASSTLFTQYFFIKLISHLRGQAYHYHHIQYQAVWRLNNL